MVRACHRCRQAWRQTCLLSWRHRVREPLAASTVIWPVMDDGSMGLTGLIFPGGLRRFAGRNQHLTWWHSAADLPHSDNGASSWDGTEPTESRRLATLWPWLQMEHMSCPYRDSRFLHLKFWILLQRQSQSLAQEHRSHLRVLMISRTWFTWFQSAHGIPGDITGPPAS